MATMAQYIEQVYDDKEIAERNARDMEKWFGYTWEILQEGGKWKLILRSTIVQMG